MLDIQGIRVALIKGLQTFTGATTIRTETTAKQPPYPYTGVKFTMLGQKIGQPAQYIRGTTAVHEQDIEMTASITCYASTVGVAETLAYSALQYLETVGVDELKDKNIAIVQTTDLTDRTTFLTTDYEYRIGFDVRLRARAQITKEAEWIETAPLTYLGGD